MSDWVKGAWAFSGADSSELTFEAGALIKVVDRGHADWWSGTIDGQTGGDREPHLFFSLSASISSFHIPPPSSPALAGHLFLTSSLRVCRPLPIKLCKACEYVGRESNHAL